MRNTIKNKYLRRKQIVKSLKERKMEDVLNQINVKITISNITFEDRLELVRWFKKSFNLGLKEAKDEVDNLYEKLCEKPKKDYIECNKILIGDLRKLSETRQNCPTGVFVDIVKTEKVDDTPLYPENVMENIHKVYIVSPDYIYSMETLIKNLKAKCEELEKNSKNCEVFKNEAKKWKEKYKNLKTSILESINTTK